MSKVRLSRRQKEAMYRDGFLILRKAVPTEMVTTARQLLNTHLGAVTQSARRSKPAVVREVAETAAAAARAPGIARRDGIAAEYGGDPAHGRNIPPWLEENNTLV